jgi:glycosyltransferase involved in cell wall biosynthesis
MAALHNELSLLITDFWNPYGDRALKLAEVMKAPAAISAANRFSQGIPNSKVKSLYSLGMRSVLGRLLRASAFPRGGPTTWIESGKRFATEVINYLDVPHAAFFGYSCACLEALREERSLGRRAVVGQVDAGRLNVLITKDEQMRHPKLAMPTTVPTGEYYSRVSAEWETASGIIVNSHWTRGALIDEGVPSSKIHVVPLTIDEPAATAPRQIAREELRVLWLGNMTLLKGLAYAIEAARQLQGSGVTFTFAGTLEHTATKLNLPPNARYVGAVPRAHVSALYRSHDVFLFPTLSDGFGITQLEAMSHGLPVIATKNCGAVVEDGRSGFIVPARNPAAICNALKAIREDPLLYQSLSSGALLRCRAFAPERVWPLAWDALFGPDLAQPDSSSNA